MEANRSPDLARVALQLLALGLLIAASVWIVRPFLVASIWACMIAVATWPLLLLAQRGLGGRRLLATALMTILLLLILVVPLYIGVSTIVENTGVIVRWSKSLETLSFPPLPARVQGLPFVGAKLAELWQQIAAAGPEEMFGRLAPFAQTLALGFVGQIGSLGKLLVQFLLTVLIAAILYANGETVARGADRFARRLAGPQGTNALHLAGQAIRGVALGVVVTAIAQSLAAGIGMAIVGVPFASILTVIAFMFCVAQLGPGLVLLPVVIWAYATQGAVWGTGFLIWAIFCSTFDNVLRPMLIRQGADLPLLLIFAGVIGGLIAFGVIGLFIGPVMLAVAYTLLVDWVSQGERSDPPAPPVAG
jgi:predicted PurR-regulated permease PerM